MRRNEVEDVPIPAVDISKLGVADAYSFLQHGCKHRLKIAGRAADDLEHLRRRGLLLQRLGKLGGALLRSSVRWRSSFNRRVFSMAITAWSAKVVTSSICLSVNGRTEFAPRRSRQSAILLAGAGLQEAYDETPKSPCRLYVYSGSVQNVERCERFCAQAGHARITIHGRFQLDDLRRILRIPAEYPYHASK